MFCLLEMDVSHSVFFGGRVTLQMLLSEQIDEMYFSSQTDNLLVLIRRVSSLLVSEIRR